ncbi:MAG: heme o synthase [Deltaproteobacteria bacterium]|nr:heme o synthase [Deltaproteobacteria bacterium]
MASPASSPRIPAGALAAPLGRAADFLALTRPRIVLAVALTAPAGLLLGGAPHPAPGLLLGVLAGTVLLGGGSGALNAWWERERDARMRRTCERPLPTGRLEPHEALVFGLVTSATGLAALGLAGGGLAAVLGLATLVHYLGVYTLWLKPRSHWSTVAGGVAGAAAPLIADAAADGAIGPWGLVLFAIVFTWQPPHVWAIALYRRDEYAAAGFPMLPAVKGARVARRHMLGWALVLVAVTLLPCLGGVAGPWYALAALAAGAFFVARIAAAICACDPAADRRAFRASLVQLAVVFAALLADLLI